MADGQPYVETNAKTSGRDFIDNSTSTRTVVYQIGDHADIAYNESRALQALLNHATIAAVHDSTDRGDAPQCHEETRTAVQGQILDWSGFGGDGSPEQRIMWLSGPAGAGKTAIMGTIANTLKRQGRLAATFFFSSFSSTVERRMKDRFITTLIYQLIQHESLGRMRCLRKKVLSFINQDPSIFMQCLGAQMEEFVLKPMRDCQSHPNCLRGDGPALSDGQLHSLVSCECQLHYDCWSHTGQVQPPDVIVVDGLDECGAIVQEDCTDSERFDAQRSREGDQAEILAILWNAVSSGVFPFRILIASRAEPHISRFFSSSGLPSSSKIFLDDKYDPDSDISLFLTAKFAQIRHRYPRISPLWPGEAVIRQLVRNASGQFIYAATIIRFVEIGKNAPTKQLDIALELPSNDLSNPLAQLDALYARVLKSSPDPVLALQWLAAYVRLDVGRFGPTTAWFWCRLCESSEGEANFLLDNLSPLLCLSDLDTPHKAVITFYHKSFQDFLSDERRHILHFPDPKHGVTHAWLTERFDWVFAHKSPQVPLLDPYQHEVFLALCRPYMQLALGRTPSGRKAIQAPVYKGGASDIVLDTDIVFPVIGLSKSGKSSFINELVGREEMKVGRTLRFCTTVIQAAVANQAPAQYEALNSALSGRRIVFVDTPGLDQSDERGGQSLVAWLEARYGRGNFLGCMVYLCDVSRGLDHDHLLRALPSFVRSCQEGGLSIGQNALLTKKWDRLTCDDTQPDYFQRLCDEHLEDAPDRWHAIMAHGRSSIHHLLRKGLGIEEPWEVIQAIVTPMHAHEMDHRIRLMQDKLVSKRPSFMQSTSKLALRRRVEGIQGQLNRLQERGASKESWDKLHWDICLANLELMEDTRPHKRLQAWMRGIMGGQ